MNNRVKQYLIALSAVIVMALINPACTLDSQGLFQENPGGSGGSGGEDATTSTSTGGNGGNTGSTTSTSTATSGMGGSGGETTSSTTTGDGGTGGTGGSGGSGSGGSGGGVTTCEAGDSGVPDSVKAQNSTLLGLMVDYYTVGVDFHSSLGSPILATFAGQMMPGQAVLAGYNGLGFELKSAGAASSRPWFIVDLDSLSTYSECDGGGKRSEACMAIVVKSYRCQYAPYLESVACPSPEVVFDAQPASDSYSGSETGWQVILADLSCP